MYLVINKLLDNKLINYSYTASTARLHTSWILALEPGVAWEPNFSFLIPLNLESATKLRISRSSTEFPSYSLRQSKGSSI